MRRRLEAKNDSPAATDHRLLIVLWLSLAFAVVCLFGLWPLEGPDLFMWSVVGRWSLEHGGPPLTDVFSYTSAGREFTAHSWLSGIIFHLLYTWTGDTGLVLLRFGLVSTALAFSLCIARMIGASWSAIALVAPFVLCVFWARLELRPTLLSTALLAGQLMLLTSVHLGVRDWRWLWVMPPIFLFWVSVHGGWIQGVFLLVLVGVALAAMGARQRWLGTGDASHLSTRRLALVLAACVLACRVNPYGWRLLYFPFQMQASWLHADGLEWQSPWANANWLAVGGGQVLSVEPIFWVYLAVLGGVVLAGLRRWRSADLLPLAVLGFWSLMCLRHIRAVGDAVLLTAPFVAAACTSCDAIRRSVWLPRLGIGLTLGLALLSLPFTVKHWDLGLDTADGEITCAATMIDRHGLSGRVFAHRFNERLLWLFHPRVTIPFSWDFVEGQRLSLEMQAYNDPHVFPHFLERYRPELIVLVHEWRSVIPSLQQRGWVVVHQDDWAVVLVPQRPDTADLIRREGYWWLKSWEEIEVTPVNAGRVLAEAERAIHACPQHAVAAWAAKVNTLHALGRTAGQ